MYEEIYALMDETINLLINFMFDNIQYLSNRLKLIWLMLFVFSFILLLIVFLGGGSIFVSKLHEDLLQSKKSLTLLDIQMIQENSYLQNYIISQMNEEKSNS